MSFCKRIAATVVALSLMVTAASCGESSSWAVKYGDYTLNSGVFIFYQTEAYSEATTILTEANKDLDLKDKKLIKTLSVENTDITEWINNKATEKMRIFLAVNDKFDSLGLELSSADIDQIKKMSESYWSYYSDQYTKNGIGKDTFKQIIEFDYKQKAVFNYYYGKGGEFEYSDEDMLTYLDENYSRVKYVALNLKDGKSEELDDAGKKEVKKMADGYVKRIKSGENIDDIIKEYKDYYDKLVADATETTDTSAENGEEPAVTTAPEETEVSSETTSPNETNASDETNNESENTSEPASSEDTAETSDEQSAAETTLADETVEEAAVTTVSGDEIENAETTVSGETGEEAETTEETDPYPNENIIFKGSEKDGYNPSQKVNEAMFNECKVDGDPVIVEDTDNLLIYVIQRFDIRERKDFLEGDARSGLLWEILEEDFEKKALEWVTEDDIKKNNRSYKRYDPFNIEV